ncbi:thermonuclease [Bacillus cereus group sp. BfR-BA-01400]|uniref:thermonuclease n=1 Tax=Bacillus cereus group sp. BfR-BA-01400 TaxID=2920334 RepID=UPI001F55F68C
MKTWIKNACITSLVFQTTACSSSTQTKPVQTAQKIIQQNVEGKNNADISEAYSS